MNESRSHFSCTVFEGKIVVSGGFNRGSLNTVEAYDHVANSWTNMPNMIEGRRYHKSIALKNKLYVFGGIFTKTYEVYDSTCKKFIALKSPHNCFISPNSVISIGSKLVLFKFRKKSLLIYDLEDDSFSEEPCEVTKDLLGFSCVKVPHF